MGFAGAGFAAVAGVGVGALAAGGSFDVDGPSLPAAPLAAAASALEFFSRSCMSFETSGWSRFGRYVSRNCVSCVRAEALFAHAREGSPTAGIDLGSSARSPRPYSRTAVPDLSASGVFDGTSFFDTSICAKEKRSLSSPELAATADASA